MTEFKGKAIYNPSGKAGEYSYWACNFYNGCSVGCTYCFNKKGRGAKILGGNIPILKACFKNEDDAHDVFRREVLKNVDELRKHGLFFSFTTDPMLPQTIGMTLRAMNTLVTNGIPIKVLTKRADWVYKFLSENSPFVNNGKAVGKHNIAFGFTLTGCDDLEPNASLNIERVRAMAQLHNAGFKTFASIEPVIDIPKSLAVINLSNGHCDLYKIGLESGRKYSKQDVQVFIDMVCQMYTKDKIYFKNSLLKVAGINRDDLPENCVTRDYNLFL